VDDIHATVRDTLINHGFTYGKKDEDTSKIESEQKFIKLEPKDDFVPNLIELDKYIQNQNSITTYSLFNPVNGEKLNMIIYNNYVQIKKMEIDNENKKLVDKILLKYHNEYIITSQIIDEETKEFNFMNKNKEKSTKMKILLNLTMEKYYKILYIKII